MKITLARFGLSLLWVGSAIAATTTTEPALKPVPLLSAEDEAKTFVLPPGYRADVVACEPMVEHPVAIAFDPKGRMWVAEMRGYMPDVDGSGELKPTGRVSVLEDTDGDGRMDKSTVFLDKLVLPRAVGFAGDGVLVGTPTSLLFCRDTDGDLKCDEKKVIATDFGVPENPENSANGLIYGLDNWIYCACWTTRIRYKGNGEFELGAVPVMGQFGLTRDDWGRWFFNTNSDYLRGSLVPPHYTSRNPKSPMSLTNTQIAKDQDVFPTSEATVNRGYREGFRRDGKLIAFTAACGPSVYRAGLMPEFYGNAFVCEATSSMVRRAEIKEKGIGLSASNAYSGKEFLTSTYERFRPVNITTGPEGAIYVVDMHHGLIQHKMSLTEYAKEQYVEKKLDKHLLTGRVFRIVPEAKGVMAQVADLSNASTGQLVGYLKHSDGWWRDTAQRILVERKDVVAVPGLKEMALRDESARVRVQAMWTLAGMGNLERDVVRAGLKDSDAKVRANAIRLAEPWLSGELFEDVAKLAGDQDAQVRLQWVLSVSGQKSETAEEALASVLVGRGKDAVIRQAAVSGMAGREIAFVKRLLAMRGCPDEVLADVARSVVRRDDPKEVAALVELIGAEGMAASQRAALAAAVPARRVDEHGVTKWIEVSAEPAAVRKLREAGDKKGAERVAGLFNWPGKPAPPKAKVAALTEDQQKLFEVGRVQYGLVCAQCHQPDGMGQEGKAPPLVGSPWVDGPPTRLVRIVLHGMRGPVTVGERTYTGIEMPALKILKDEQIAGVLTYIRRSWGHEGSPVDVAFVQGIRDWNQARRDGWTEKELLGVK